MSAEKNCPVCKILILGRTDKKFCSVKCKSIYQYEKRQENEVFFLKVDKQLKVNRKILKKYNLTGLSIIRKSELHADGFNPKYFTHYWKNKKNEVYLFVYEFGFLSKIENGKEKYILVKWQHYME